MTITIATLLTSVCFAVRTSFLSVTIEGDIQSFHPIKLVIYDPSGNIVYQPNVPIDGDGKFKYFVTPPIPRFDEGQYTIEVKKILKKKLRYISWFQLTCLMECLMKIWRQKLYLNLEQLQ